MVSQPPAQTGEQPQYMYAHQSQHGTSTDASQQAPQRTLITIVNRSPYVRGLQVRDPVRAQCGIEDEVPADIAAFAQQYWDIAWATESQGVRGWVLETWVVGVIAPGGGGWSGRKQVTVEGRLTFNGQLIGTFVARRSSGGGHRECTLLQNCAHTLGSDITHWLLDPQMDARLGELRTRV